MEDTIVAVSTAMGVGAISIVRVTGPKAIDIVNNIYKEKDLMKEPTHTIHYGHIIDSDLVIDEVLIMLMRAPKTFTTEDTVEINCHGGIATTKKVLELLLKKGCRLADPGEFTKRAFLNGRIDLIEAEGVMDLIEAKTEEARKMAISSISGNVTSMIQNLRKKIVDILANIEVNIDYPEYDDVEQIETEQIIPLMKEMKQEMEYILKESENGKLLKDGIKTSIIGRPNVGKSSLLNALLEEDKAIVTSIAGTTRDIVEGTITLDGIVLNMIDTAGIRSTEDIVEKIGVEKSIKLIEDSNLVLFVLNNNEELKKEDIEILNKLKDKNHIIIINKMDLEEKLDLSKLSNHNIVRMSILKKEGLDELKNQIRQLFDFEKITTGNFTYLSNAREISLLKEAYDSLLDVINGVNKNIPIDMIEIDIKNIWNILGNIIGESYEEELIDQLFSQFCLGK